MVYISSVKKRCVLLGEYIIEHNSTVRATAAYFGMSKSTVHKDVTETLRCVHPALYAEVQEVLHMNKSVRHLRGGEATRQKYISLAQKRKDSSA